MHPPHGISDIIGGKYRIIREIARSNDIVYEAVDQTMGRRIAIKELLLPPNLTGLARRERIERFGREARAAGKLSHPNIVTIYDFGEDGGRYFIAMEYLEGGTLRDRLQTAGPLPMGDVLGYAYQMLAALAHAHANRVIHRDVKPDNVYILPDGLIKLTDFGIARLTEEASLTGDGQVFGTPSYMSPEQIEGRTIDTRSDLFSTAIVLYEMLTGHKPFTGDSVVSITYAIMNAQPAPAHGIPESLQSVLTRGLAKLPSARFQTAEEMRKALSDAAASLSDGRTDRTQHQPSGRFPPHSLRPDLSPHPGVSSAHHGATPTAATSALPPRYPAGPTPASNPPTPATSMPAGTVSGPFADWGNTGRPAASAPDSMRQGWSAPGPLLSERSRTFLGSVAIGFVLAAIILGATLSFVRSYEERQKSVGVLAAQSTLREAEMLVTQGQLQQAAQLYAQVLRTNAETAEGRTARSNLAEVRMRLGVIAAQQGEPAEAERYFNEVIELYDGYPASLSPADMSRYQSALENLAAIRMNTGPSGGTDSSRNRDAPTQGPDLGAQALSARSQEAERYLEQGDNMELQGDRRSARELWQRAAAAAPGTPPAIEANTRLNNTRPGFDSHAGWP